MQSVNRCDGSDKLRTKELELAPLCTQTKYRIVTTYVRFLLRASALKLSKRTQNSNLKNILKPIDLALPFMTNNNHKKATFTIRAIQTLSFILIIFITSLSAAMCILQYIRDKLLADMKPRVEPNAIQYEHCVLNSSVYLHPGDRHRQEILESIRRWNDFIGNPWSSMAGVNELGTIWTSLVLFIIPVWGIVFTSRHTVQHDHLSFLFDPFGEQLRIRHVLARMVKFKLEELNNLISNIVEIYAESKINHHPGAKGAFATSPLATDLYLKILGRPSMPTRCLRNSLVLELTQYRLLLMRIQRLELVKPAILSHKWYKTTINLHLYFLLPISCTNFILTQMIFGGLTFLALLTRTNHRLEQLECKKWMPNGVHLIDKIHLEPLNSGADQELYTNYDGSLKYYVWLATFIEAKYLFTSSVLFNQASIHLIAGTFWPLWISCYAYLHFYSAIRRSVWIDQLERQIGDCRRSMETMTLDGWKKHGEQFARDLIVANLNFELFRCHRRDSIKFDRFILNQAALLVASIFLVFQWTRDLMGSHDLYLKLASLYLAIYMNTYLLSEVSIVSRLEKLNRNFMSLSARSEGISAYRCYPIQLWVRQLLNDSWRHLMPELFGFQLSYTRILSFNGYFFAFWLLLMR